MARRLADQITGLPVLPDSTPPPPDRLHVREFPLRGLETCEVCGETVNMGHLTVCHPAAALYTKLSYLALHSLRHGGLSFAGDVHGHGRTDPHLLTRALDPAFPRHLTPIPHDTDGDGLTDAEEPRFDCDPKQSDTSSDGVPDGFALARAFWTLIEALPTVEHPDGHRVDHRMRGLVDCPVCGDPVNMGFLEIVHPRRQQTLTLSYLDLHFLRHGSFVRPGTGRLDPLALEAALRPSVLVLPEPGQVSLRWNLRRGFRYQLWAGDSPLGPWELLTEHRGEGTEATHIEPLPHGTPARFYRLTVR